MDNQDKYFLDKMLDIMSRTSEGLASLKGQVDRVIEIILGSSGKLNDITDKVNALKIDIDTTCKELEEHDQKFKNFIKDAGDLDLNHKVNDIIDKMNVILDKDKFTRKLIYIITGIQTTAILGLAGLILMKLFN